MNPPETRPAPPARRRRKRRPTNHSGNTQRLITGTTGRTRPIFPTLRAWRAARRLSQREAADVVGISQTLYSRLERGTVATKGAIAKRLVLVTGVPLETLVGAA